MSVLPDQGQIHDIQEQKDEMTGWKYTLKFQRANQSISR